MIRKLNALAALALMCGGLAEAPSAPAMLRRLTTRTRQARTCDPMPVLAHEPSMALAHAGVGFFGTDAGAYYLAARPAPTPHASSCVDGSPLSVAQHNTPPFLSRIAPLARIVPTPKGRLVVRPLAQLAPDVRAIIEAWIAGQREEGVAVAWGAGVPRDERHPTPADLSSAMPDDMAFVFAGFVISDDDAEQDAEPQQEPDDAQEAQP
jgi:hypothetical protein